ncbi:YbaN family protein [Sphingobium sp. BHU LFT2]|uniref:YbaN family protein n=1 Tax=Sphingobium sp. BHU LFT2 TaxID=2807634 RepID=UPI001BE874EC|nr:YbaN family protein [Sphingobium sp. BHU LFT2]MBT2245921.1 YbaN family protein [Sphingobium sp. BHU LFT2]
MRVLVEASGNDLLRRGRVARAGWLMLGMALVVIGFVGIFVPLLPTTDFLLLALPCFARSSPRLEGWLLNHPRYGPSLRAWRTERAVPRHAKIAACFGMALGYGLFWFHLRPGLLLTSAVAAFMLFWAIWIVRRPEPGVSR